MTDDQARSAEIAGEIGQRILAKQARNSHNNPITPGQAVVLVKVQDTHTRLEPMATGVVVRVDEAAVHIAWDPDGHVLGLIPGVDEWRELHPRWQATPLEEVKVCPHCKQQKSVDDFALRRKDGTARQAWCRACVNATRKENRRG